LTQFVSFFKSLFKNTPARVYDFQVSRKIVSSLPTEEPADYSKHQMCQSKADDIRAYIQTTYLPSFLYSKEVDPRVANAFSTDPQFYLDRLQAILEEGRDGLGVSRVKTGVNPVELTLQLKLIALNAVTKQLKKEA
jgi:hypothetical protein